MKKCVCLLLSSVLLVSLCACNNAPDASDDSSSVTTISTTTTTATTTTDTTTTKQAAFSSSPYAEVKEANARAEIARLDWEAILAQIPTDRYELYPGLNGAPTTATLYKDGESISIDVYDPRLVRMINFYNNIVYHQKHAYTQGRYSDEYYNELASSDFRLVLTYENDYPDKQIICGHHFIDVYSNLNAIEDTAPALGRFPLYVRMRDDVVWLTVFGF